MGKLFDLEKEGYFYSRLQNPTCDIVAQKICDLEGGVAAMLTSSGQAATMLAVTNICEAGDHIICAAKIYGGTSNLLAVTLHRFGVEVDLVDQDLPEEELEKYFKPNTKAVLPAISIWGGYCHAFHDKIYGWTCHGTGWLYRGQWKL